MVAAGQTRPIAQKLQVALWCSMDCQLNWLKPIIYKTKWWKVSHWPCTLGIEGGEEPFRGGSKICNPITLHHMQVEL